MPSLLASFDSRAWVNVSAVLLRLARGSGFAEVRVCLPACLSKCLAGGSGFAEVHAHMRACFRASGIGFPTFWRMQAWASAC
jgi:hypothetical protein